MEHMNIFADLDKHERSILRALAKRPSQNIYQLEKTSEVSRKAIYGRLGGELRLKRKKSTLIERDYVREEYGEKLQTGHRKRLLFPTFKGALASSFLYHDDKEVRERIAKYRSEFGNLSEDAFLGALKLWLHYRSWMMPKEIDEISSEKLLRDLKFTIWNGVRYTLLEMSKRGWGGGIPEEPRLYLTSSLFSLESVFKGFGLSKNEASSLVRYLIDKDLILSEISMLEFIDIALREKYLGESLPLTRGTIRAGCLLIDLDFELKKANLSKLFKELVKNPDRRIEIKEQILDEVNIGAPTQILGKCNMEKSCPYRGKDNLKKLGCKLVERDLIL